MIPALFLPSRQYSIDHSHFHQFYRPWSIVSCSLAFYHGVLCWKCFSLSLFGLYGYLAMFSTTFAASDIPSIEVCLVALWYSVSHILFLMLWTFYPIVKVCSPDVSKFYMRFSVHQETKPQLNGIRRWWAASCSRLMAFITKFCLTKLCIIQWKCMIFKTLSYVSCFIYFLVLWISDKYFCIAPNPIDRGFLLSLMPFESSELHIHLLFLHFADQFDILRLNILSIFIR